MWIFISTGVYDKTSELTEEDVGRLPFGERICKGSPRDLYLSTGIPAVRHYSQESLLLQLKWTAIRSPPKYAFLFTFRFDWRSPFWNCALLLSASLPVVLTIPLSFLRNLAYNEIQTLHEDAFKGVAIDGQMWELYLRLEHDVTFQLQLSARLAYPINIAFTPFFVIIHVC